MEWAADYLQRVDELPVLAQVAPGELAARRMGAGAGAKACGVADALALPEGAGVGVTPATVAMGSSIR